MLLYRARSGETQTLAPRGLPVGLAGSDTRTFESHLDVEKVQLQHGDVLLLYTDGITEARDAAGEEYGEKRLAAALERWAKEGAEALVRHLEADLLAFTGGAPPQDDLTLVAIQENAAVAPVAGEVMAKLFDLVDVQGMRLLDACKKLKVSPSTYYRLKREAVEGRGAA